MAKKNTVFVFRDRTHMQRAMGAMDRAYGGKPPGYSLDKGWAGKEARIFLDPTDEEISKVVAIFKKNGIVVEKMVAGYVTGGVGEDDLSDFTPPVIMYSAPDGLDGAPRGSDQLPEDAIFVEMVGPQEKWQDPEGTLYAVNPSTRQITNVTKDVRRKKYKRPPRVGTRVRFTPNPASLQLYSSPPDEGEEGEVTTVAGPRGQMSFMRGPGGGLVYVEWDNSGPMGVSLYDIEKA